MMDIQKAVARYERQKLRRRQRYKEDSEYRKKVLEYRRAWIQANPGKSCLYSRRSQAKRKAQAVDQMKGKP